MFLLVLGEDTPIDLKRVHERIGAQGRVSFGSAELLEEVWGVKPGAVTPFGAINDRKAKGHGRDRRRDAAATTAQLPSRWSTPAPPAWRAPTSSSSCAPIGHEPMVVALGSGESVE